MSRDTETTRELPAAKLPPVGLGMTSTSLACVGMVLIWLPILGGPISGAGLVIGLLGLASWLIAGVDSLRWCLRGIVLCSLALSVNAAIYYAPGGFLPLPEATPATAPVPTGMDAPPPAPL